MTDRLTPEQRYRAMKSVKLKNGSLEKSCNVNFERQVYVSVATIMRFPVVLTLYFRKNVLLCS